MPMLTREAAHTMRLDGKPDGTHILFKIIAMPGQYVLHFLEGKEEAFWGVSTTRLEKAFGVDAIDSGWLPTGICRWGRHKGGDWMIRLYPAALYTLQFGLPDHLDAYTVSVRLPALLFAGLHETYYVWAVKDQFLAPQTHLYRVPLSNVYGDGRICYGSNRPPAVSASAWETIDEAWRLFIASPFIGDLSDGKSLSHPRNVWLSLVEAARLSDTPYPVSDLVAYTTNNATPVTVAKVVDAMIHTAKEL